MGGVYLNEDETLEKENGVNEAIEIDLPAAVRREFLALADLLDTLPVVSWDTPSLCAGWRVREVVEHTTMAVRTSPFLSG